MHYPKLVLKKKIEDSFVNSVGKEFGVQMKIKISEKESDGTLKSIPTLKISEPVATLPSLAISGKKYYPCQVRIMNGNLHIQVNMKGKGNRPYGFSLDAMIPSDFKEFINSTKKTKVSFTNSGELYAAAQIRKLETGVFHLQIAAYPSFNRKYGASINLNISGAKDFPA